MNPPTKFKDSVLGTNSPFPWAPGHAYMELEFLCYKKLVSSDPRDYLFPWVDGPISQGLRQAFSDILAPMGVKILHNPLEIQKAFLESDLIDVSVSSIKYIRRQDISSLHYRTASQDDIYSSMLKGTTRVQSLYISNQGLQTDYEDFYEMYIGHDSFFEEVRTQLAQRPSILPSSLARHIDKNDALVLINIREHHANASSGMDATDFEAVASYLRDKCFSVVDIGHDLKSQKALDLCKKYEIYPYWSIPEKSADLDIELFSRASYYLGGGGPSHLAMMLRVPFLWIGSLYPLQIIGSKSLQLPCLLTRKRGNCTLEYDEAFGIFLTRPELWENKYDSWLKQYGAYNMHNCIDEIRHKFTIHRPNAYAILAAFMQLEDIARAEAKPHRVYTSRSRDLLGRLIHTLDCPNAWNG